MGELHEPEGKEHTLTGSLLVVDDEPAIRYFLEKALTRAGHEVITVASGEAALNYAAIQRFDLALLDLRMKGIDGITTLRQLRAAWPHMQVIVLTAHASLETAVEALRYGASDYLFKPCNTADLCASVQKALRKQIQPAQPVVEPAPGVPKPSAQPPAGGPGDTGAGKARSYGDLLIDPLRHQVTCSGVQVDLSPIEFALLAYLQRAAPRVVAGQELLREVLGYDAQPWEARDTLRSHIYHIRRKIRDAGGCDPIRNVRGIGYTVTG